MDNISRKSYIRKRKSEGSSWKRSVWRANGDQR